MGFREWWYGEKRSADDSTPPASDSPALTIPSREMSARSVSSREALGLSDVFRAVEIRATAAKQISFDLERQGRIVPSAPALLTKPDPDFSRSQFVEQTVVSLALAGNAFWRVGRAADGSASTAWVMNPHDVEPKTTASGRVLGYQYRGKLLSVDEVQHLARLRIPGMARGLGPIQAAQLEVRGALDVAEYASGVLYEGDTPSGILKSDMVLTKETADAARKQWKDTNAGRMGVAVLGQGLDYRSTFLSPKDAQFIESQEWNTAKITRLFGVPASLMLVSAGGSRVYQNVEQDWLGFVRFGLASDLTEMEDAFTRLLPRGAKATANTAALLKTDTKTRYETHNLALNGRWRTVNEIRAIEGLDPIDGGDALPAAPSAPQAEATNAA